MNKQGILVVGSSNMDLVVSAKRFPSPGETVFGNKFEMFPGGKGANQAVSAARLGCKTTFICKMGNDEFQKKLSQTMAESGIDIKNLFIDENESTGTALITVDEKGQNQIIVISGSNMKLTPCDIETKSVLFEEASVVLTQLEIPVDTVVKTAHLAKKNNAFFILNPAPAMELPDSIFPFIDYLTPNEKELELLSGINIIDESSLKNAAKMILKKGVNNLIVTLGEKGSLLINYEKEKLFPAAKVDVIDTTAAGDVFNGAFAASIAEGKSPDEAIEFANYAAAISVTKMGAQSSIPYKHEIKN